MNIFGKDFFENKNNAVSYFTITVQVSW